LRDTLDPLAQEPCTHRGATAPGDGARDDGGLIEASQPSTSTGKGNGDDDVRRPKLPGHEPPLSRASAQNRSQTSSSGEFHQMQAAANVVVIGKERPRLTERPRVRPAGAAEARCDPARVGKTTTRTKRLVDHRQPVETTAANRALQRSGENALTEQAAGRVYERSQPVPYARSTGTENARTGKGERRDQLLTAWTRWVTARSKARGFWPRAGAGRQS
jgi:hypothetical protein